MRKQQKTFRGLLYFAAPCRHANTFLPDARYRTARLYMNYVRGCINVAYIGAHRQPSLPIGRGIELAKSRIITNRKSTEFSCHYRNWVTCFSTNSSAHICPKVAPESKFTVFFVVVLCPCRSPPKVLTHQFQPCKWFMFKYI